MGAVTALVGARETTKRWRTGGGAAATPGRGDRGRASPVGRGGGGGRGSSTPLEAAVKMINLRLFTKNFLLNL